MGERIISGVDLEGLGVAWSTNPHIQELLEDAATTSLVQPADGDRVALANQACAVKNEPFLAAILMRMREARSLHLPSISMLEEQLTTTWVKHHQYVYKRRLGKAGAGRNPKLPPDFSLSDRELEMCHADSKSLKTLLSMVKKQFISERVAHESRQACYTEEFCVQKRFEAIPSPQLPRTRTTGALWQTSATRLGDGG